jgi:hypothetical protein
MLPELTPARWRDVLKSMAAPDRVWAVLLDPELDLIG